MVEITDGQLKSDFGAATGEATRSGLYSRRIKRVCDVLAILIAAPIVVPLVAVFAMLVSRDGGPAFYKQERVGRFGRIFKCWKLRTMVVDADRQLEAYLEADPEARAEWERTQKLKNDPRVTRVGQILRKTSLDELPQLWNVLRGDMSLVGPRPMMPEQMDIYPGQAYYQMRPGITGLWQVSDRNSSAFAARAVHDTAYANRVSFTTDVGVLLATVPAVVRGTGC